METFQGFFSYAHHDAETDPALVEAFTHDLEKRVSGKMTGANFNIWRDTKGLRTGVLWDDGIREAVLASHVLIVLLTPKWFERDYCRKEYEIFRQVEANLPAGKYVVPLLARDVDSQIRHFTPDQETVYRDLNARQYKKTLATNFLYLTQDERTRLVDEIADDVAGMIERLRTLLAAGADPSPKSDRPRQQCEFDTIAQDFTKVGVVSAAEILLEPKGDKAYRSVYADLAFVELLYIQSGRGRLEFGVKRAYLSLEAIDGAASLARHDEWETSDRSGVLYVIYHPIPQALTVCVTAPRGRSLGELPLPPAASENRLSKVATIGRDATTGSILATLDISLCPEGLFIVGEDRNSPPEKIKKKIAAIVAVAAKRGASAATTKMIQRAVPVRERDR